jgi:hypothetical protein
MPRRLLLSFAIVLAATPLAAPAQIIRDPSAPVVGGPRTVGALDVSVARAEQSQFERFRRNNLPSARSSPPSDCEEVVGRFCYWYDEKDILPKEPQIIANRREQLIAMLDTLARTDPEDRWITGQRVRYLAESERLGDALTAAHECRLTGWWCDVLVGFSLHLLGEYVASDSVYEVALGKMAEHDRCVWRSVDLLLDDDARQQYRRTTCGDPEHRKFEDRAWFFARTLYSKPGNDSRTEHFARMTMTLMLADAPSPYESGFDDDERELLLRFGWPRAWAIASGQSNRVTLGMPGFPGGIGGRGGRRGGRGFPGGGGRGMPRGRGGREGEAGSDVSVIGMEPIPAYRYIPPGFVLNNPAISDSSAWRLQLPPVIGRYAPPYASTLKPLEHQKAMFRRGDSALVVMAYDARTTKELDGAKLNAALVIAPNNGQRDYATIVHGAQSVGALMAKAPWGPLIMSAEVAAPEKHAVARARYGLSPAYEVGERVTVSDLLFYKPYGSFPQTAEEAAPHAVPTERLRADEKLGVYWESYGTDPAGEKLGVSLTVVKEAEESGFMRRMGKALKLVREATPVTVSVSDMSARGTRVSPRALELDMSTLRKGSYIVQLEITVAGQYVIRADHRIEVIGP